jgi:hydrophobic/amphiphilic exporter-1 (mainly G- bacteria), HAE1 family
VPKNFLPDDDESEFQVNVQTPEGTSLEATQALIGRIARDVRSLNGVSYTIASVADTEQRLANSGSIYTRLIEPTEREFGQFDIMNFIRTEILSKYQEQNLRVTVSPVPAFSGGGYANAYIQYLVSGPDMKQLAAYATDIKAALAAIPGAVDVDSSLQFGNPEYGIYVDRARAADLGVSVLDVASTLRLVVEGDDVSQYNEGGEQYDVHLRAAYGARNSIDVLRDITVPSSKLGSVPLYDVVTFSEGIGPTQINRLNRKRQVTITANLGPGASQQAILNALDQAVSQMSLAPGYETRLVGQSEELAKAFQNFILAFAMAFIFVYLVLAAQFESWIHPVTILLALPLTLPFALVALLLFGESLNVFSLLGVMVLFAVVKKNSILQIDHTNQLRAQGMPRDEAIIAANMDRLRPILMTTISFVAGMVPLLISTQAGAGTNKTISSVIIGGQTLSLLLTLIATPVAYSIFDDMRHARVWGWIGNAIVFLPRMGRRAVASIVGAILHRN